jgi:succinate dehydrogenase/fumarate reductase flavoprotein subunit
MYTYETDVLIVGGGGGGAMAAYEATKHGVEVTVVLKGSPQHCGVTIMAPGAISGVGNWHVDGDTLDLHFSDTVRGGAFLNEQTMVRAMVEEAPDRILELERIGAMWQRDDQGKTYALRIDGGHSYPRCPYLEDRTGREILRALFGELKKRNVRVMPNIMILKLLQAGGKICGAVGIDLENCEPVLLRSKALVLACGGAGTIYQNTSNPPDMTGDGFGLAFEAGAQLMDMEFVQFYPLGFVYPDSLKGILGGLLYYLHLRNKDGERFMANYDPLRLELSTRDRVARAMMTEIREGRGGERGGVFGDMTYHEPGYIAKMQPALYKTYRKIGIDPEKDYLELAPTCHFFMGGIKVNENWQSSIAGLFAVGENSAGLHGANRLSQNALAELLVSGVRAGREAAKAALDGSQGPVNPSEAKVVSELVKKTMERDKGVRPCVLRDKLRRIMWDQVGVVRTKDGLSLALERLADLRADLELQHVTLQSKRFNQEMIEALENRFMVTTAQCVAKAALLRTESRGAHYRDDFASQDDSQWLKHIVLRQENGGLQAVLAAVDLSEMKPGKGVQ